MIDDLPSVPNAPVLVLKRSSALALIRGIRSRTPKVASGSVEVAGVDGVPVKLSLGIRVADDGTTISLKKQNGEEESSSDSSSDNSQDSDSQPSNQESSGPDESNSESSKTAIVPFQGKYIGWVCSERPEAKFEDVVRVEFAPGQTLATIQLEPEFLSGVEPGTAVATSCLPDALVPATAKINAESLVVRVGVCPGEVLTHVLVHIEGTRKGHVGRWIEYTPEEAEANRLFYNLAHDPEAWL